METVVKQEPLPAKAVVSARDESTTQPGGRESREESHGKREQTSENREDSSENTNSKTQYSKSKAKGGNNKKGGGGRFQYPNTKMPNRPPYPMVRGGGPPYGPPPYGPFMNAAYGPPPPHYPPPPPHMSMPPYGGGPFPGGPPMKGPGPNYPPPYPGPAFGMPAFPHPPNGAPSFGNMGSSSDSVSISSKNSMNSKKKRTIDGLHNTSESSNNNSGPNYNSYRQTDSNSSSASTMTAGNNTSMDTHQNDDSQQQQKRDRTGSGLSVLNMDGMVFEEGRDGQQQQKPVHRRNHSGASTASSLSVCGFSLASIEGQQQRGPPEEGAKGTKRQKKSASLVVDTNVRPPSTTSHSIDAEQSSRFGQLSLEKKPQPSSGNSATSSASGRNIFLSLSTSPINASADVDATPVKANTSKRVIKSIKQAANPDRPSDTPTPPVHGEMGDTEVHHDDHNMLNRHLRGQSFTPLPHIHSSDNANPSPSNTAFGSAIAPQLSWSIAGDTPSLGDLADWEEEHNKLKPEHQKQPRPHSTTSHESRNMPISPQSFQMWKEEHEIAEHGTVGGGTTTPLPVFFEQSGNGKGGNHGKDEQKSFGGSAPNFSGSNPTSSKPAKHEQQSQKDSSQQEQSSQHPQKHPSQQKLPPQHPPPPPPHHHHPHHPAHDHQHQPPLPPPPPPPVWSRHEGGTNPTPILTATDFRDDMFAARSPGMHDRRETLDIYQSFQLLGQGVPNDRIRNLRGRMHPHLHPLPLHIPPPISAHLPMTSPMGLGPAKNMWSPHHGMPGGLGSPHHLASPLANMAQSKRKCVPLKPPIPSKFQGDIEKHKSAPVPEFTSLVNFPTHMSQKQAVNLPEGMRCCVMCGQACPCSTGNKGKNKSKKSEGGMSRQDQVGDKNSGYAIIPTQNKGLCTLCDVNVWIVVASGLEIKWCKGCKNFRPWAAFGDKGLATKCLRCRERQREKYALQKEEKEKARAAIMAKAAAAN